MSTARPVMLGASLAFSAVMVIVITSLSHRAGGVGGPHDYLVLSIRSLPMLPSSLVRCASASSFLATVICPVAWSTLKNIAGHRRGSVVRSGVVRQVRRSLCPRGPDRWP